MSWQALTDVTRDAAEPLTTQIQTTIRQEISQGTLHPGARLPSSRQLAQDLKVSRSVVVEAYGQLVAEGYLEALRGSGTRVAAHLAQAPTVPTLLDDGHVPDVRWDLRAGTTGTADFPRREWLAAYRRALLGAGRRELGYPPLSGATALRTELAGYLGRARGAVVTPRQVMVVSGFAQALGLLCAALPRLGITELAVEDPCHQRQRQFVGEAGMRTRPVPVDEHGIDVDALARTGARAVLVTPAHQFPTGTTLGAQRRAALVRWAEEVDGLVVEDDYDGELWFADGPRPSALQRLAPERVLYAGTASKSLAPALRLAWLAVPARLTAALERARSQRDLGSEIFTQLAFAELLASGAFDRHLRRQRARYRARRALLDRAVRTYLPQARVAGSAAGLHAYLLLPRHVDEARLVAAALRRSVLVRGGAHFRDGPGPGRPALVVGYAGVPRTAIPDAVRALGAASAELPGAHRPVRCA